MGRDHRHILLPVPLLAALALAVLGSDTDVSTAQSVPPPLPLDIVGHLGGAPHDVVLADHYAYVATGYALDVWDVGDPTRPVRAGRLLRRGVNRGGGGGGYYQRLVVDGNRAFLGDRNMVRLIDVSDPAAPTETSMIRLWDAWVADVVPNGAYLYVASTTSFAGVIVIDVSDPSSPLEVTRTADGTYRRLALDGDRLLAVGRTSIDAPVTYGMSVYDISTPGSPVETTVTEVVAGGAYDLAMAGTDLYVATNAGLRIYDVADPTAVREVALYATSEPVEAVVVWTDRAYLSRNGYVEVLDVSDPRAPRIMGSLRVAEGQRTAGWSSIAAAAGVVVVTDAESGVGIVDAADPAHLVEVHRLGAGLTAWSYRLAVGDRYAFMTDSRNLYVVDVADPVSPTLVHERSVPGRVADVATWGTMLCVLAEEGGDVRLDALDVSNPLSPALVGTVNLGEGHPLSLAVRGDYVYVSAQSNAALTSTATRRLHVVFVTSDAQWRVGGLDIPNATPPGEGYPDLALLDNDLLFGLYGGFAVVDDSDPLHPALVGRLDLGPASAIALAGTGSSGYLAFDSSVPGSADSVGAYDVSDPAAPRVVASRSANYFPRTLALSANHLFSGAHEGIELFDNDPPEQLRRIDSQSLPSLVGSIVLRNGYAYVADNDAGLFILYTGDADLPVALPTPALPTPIRPNATPTPTPSPTPTTSLTITATAVPTTASPPIPPATSEATCVCRKLRGRVPSAVIDDALANPNRIYGWQKPLNPNTPVGPHNPRRTCLSLRSLSTAYHPLFNAVEWRVGCQ